MKFLLDTNVWVTVLRKPTSQLANRFRALDPSRIQVCSIVVAELRHGCLKSANPIANRRTVDSLLAPFQSLPFDDSCAEEFANIRQFLENSGLLIGPYDLQIAAIAKANHCVLVTHNTAEFGRVPGLVLDDWQLL